MVASNADDLDLDLDLCPYCGSEWKSPQAVAGLAGWVVVHCTKCDATKISAGGRDELPG